MLEGRHIAMVVRSFSVGGGLELYAHKLVEGLVAKGLRVTVVCAENKSDFQDRNLDFIHFPVADPKLPKWQRLQHQFQEATDAVKEAGPFDLVHSQHLPIAGADVVTFHNHTVSRLSRVGKPWERAVNCAKVKFAPAYRLRDMYDQMLCRHARCLMFSSKACRNDFYETYGSICALDNTPSVVAYPGADLGGSSTERQPDCSKRDAGTFTFLFVGRGYRKKGLDVLLKACRTLAGTGRRFKLLVAGMKDKPLDRLRLKFLGLEDMVEYLGFRQDMDAVYAQASALVMPSRLEPFGMAPLQAMRWAIVPIVSRLSGVSEVLKDGENALILENHLDHAELAALMTRMIDEGELLRSMRIGASEVSSTLTWDKCLEATLEGYRLALGSKATLKSPGIH